MFQGDPNPALARDEERLELLKLRRNSVEAVQQRASRIDDLVEELRQDRVSQK
jgi:hypothetical protein